MPPSCTHVSSLLAETGVSGNWLQAALVLRGVAKGYPPPLPFVIVSMAATGVVTIGWRTALAAFSHQVPCPHFHPYDKYSGTPLGYKACCQCQLPPAGGLELMLSGWRLVSPQIVSLCVQMLPEYPLHGGIVVMTQLCCNVRL